MRHTKHRHQTADRTSGRSPLILAISFLAVSASLFLSANRVEAAWSYIATGQPHSIPKDAVVTTADVLGTGRPQLVIGSGTAVQLIRLDRRAADGGWALSNPVRLGGDQPVAPISTVLPVDLNGDGRDELAIGTEGAGSLSLFQVSRWTSSVDYEGDVAPAAEPAGGQDVFILDALSQLGYMWQEIVDIQAGDMTGDGFIDLLAATSSGDMTLYTYNVSATPHIYRYHPTWTGRPLDDRPWDQVSTINWDGDGDMELVLASTDDYLGVYDWTGSGWEPVWENYPWGRLTHISSIPGDDSDGGSSSLFVVTSQRILYKFGWESNTFGLAFNTHEPLLVGEAFLSMTGPPPATSIGEEVRQPDAPRLMVAGRAGLISFRVAGSGLTLESNTGFLSDVRALYNLSDDHLAVLTKTGQLWALKPVPDDYLKVQVNGRASDLWRSPLVVQTDLYIDVLDVARLLGDVDWEWDEATGTLHLRRAGNHVQLRAGEYAAHWNDILEVMPAPLRVVGNRPYVPANVIAYLGASVNWEAPYRRLTIEKNSFWDWLSRR